MPNRFFEISENITIPGRWELGHLLDSQGQPLENPWQFRVGTPVSTQQELRVQEERSGQPVDFSHAAFSTPIVHPKVAAIFARLAPDDVQLVPVTIGTHPEKFFILNAIRLVKCIDDAASTEVHYWQPEDGLPEKVGTYFSVSGMRIDTSKVAAVKVLRPWGWEVALIVSEDIKAAMEQVVTTGAQFTEVTGPSLLDPQERARKTRLLEWRQRADAARDAVWRTLGRVEEEDLIPILVGGSWPARRQVWRVIHRQNARTLLVSHGLSDFFVDREEPSVGFGLELALETDELIQDISKEWPLLLLKRVADKVVEQESARERVRAGLFFMEVSGKDMPKSLRFGTNKVAVLTGVKSSTLPKHFSTPFGEVQLITVKALLPREGAYAKENAAVGQSDLARLFVQNGDEHLSRLRRMPVL